MPAALPLYCQALARFAVAYEISHAGRPPISPLPRVAEALQLVADPVRQRGRGDALDRVMAGSRHLPDDPPDEPRALRALLEAMEAVTCAARAAAQVPSLRDVRVDRWIRVTASALLVSLLFAALIHWIRAPRNLARGKQIVASSVGFGRPDALVNGAIEWGRFAFTTQQQDPSDVTIDLGRDYQLIEARIYNRGDSYLEQQVPLDVSLSADGSSYSTTARCTEFFTQTTPCTVPLHSIRARYVRVSRRGELALSEIEVFGR